MAERGLGKSALPTSMTGLPGWNIRDSGFGVDCVWINIVLLCPVENGEGNGEAGEEKKALWLRGWNDGVVPRQREQFVFRVLWLVSGLREFKIPSRNRLPNLKTLPLTTVIVHDLVFFCYRDCYCYVLLCSKPLRFLHQPKRHCYCYKTKHVNLTLFYFGRIVIKQRPIWYGKQLNILTQFLTVTICMMYDSIFCPGFDFFLTI